MFAKRQPGVTEQTSVLLKWLLLLCFLLVIISRNSSFFADPRFWAEEASIYFTHAYNHSFSEQLAFMAAGYYNFINVVSTALAHRLVPLESAPIVTTLIALGIQLLPAFIIIFGNIQAFSGFRLKIPALLIMLFMIPNQEVWLNVINSQFYLAITTALILLHHSTSLIEKFSYSVIVLMSGFSGLISLFLFPLFVIRAVSLNDREKWLQSGLLLFAGLVQAFLILNSENGLRQGHFEGPVFFFIFMIKTVLLPTMGPELTQSIVLLVKENMANSWFVIPITMALTALLLWFLFRKIKPSLTTEARYLLASSILLFFFSVYGALGDKAQLLNALGSGRYFIAPNTLFYLSLLAMLASVRVNENSMVNKIGWFLVSVLGLVLITGMLNFWSDKSSVSMSGPSWKQQIVQNRDGLRKIMIWPEGWFVNLNEQDNQLLEHCQNNRFMENNRLCLIYSDEKVKIKILLTQHKPQSIQYDLLTYKILENRNPTSFPAEVIYHDVLRQQDNRRQTVKLKILQDGVFFSALLIDAE